MSYVLCDSHSLGYAAQEATKLTSGDREVQAIFGMIHRARDFRTQPWCDKLVFLWDGHTSWRYKEYPGYKKNRVKDPKMGLMRESFKAQIPTIKEALYLLGCNQAYALDCEADDLAGYFAKLLDKAGHEVTLVTGDRDWLQLVSPRVRWYSHRTSQFVKDRSFADYTGYETAAQFLEGKALQGDQSDCIPGVGKIGERGAEDLIRRYGSVDEFVRLFHSGALSSEKINKAWTALAHDLASEKEPELTRQAVFRRNKKLMDLQNVPKPNGLQVLKGVVDPAGFKEFCQRLNFNSMLEDYESFMRPFISPKE